MKRYACLVVAAVLMLPACYRGGEVTSTGKGRPDVKATVPAEAEPGETVEAVVSVSNPGPGDMASVVVAFSRVGDPSLPLPIVEVGSGGRSDGIAGVTPQPEVISEDGVRYRFRGLPEGGTIEITFELVMPEARGDVGNAVTVYDGDEPERARGTRISISLG